jgi:hypothetical protein
LIEKVKGDLDALEKIPEGPEKKQFKQALSEKLAFLVSRAEADIPVARAKDRKRKMITAMVGGGVVLLTIILLIAVIIGAIKKNIKTPPTALSDQPQNAVNLVKDDPSQPIETSAKEIATGQYKEYKGEFVEVTSWTTYFRDEPKQSAKEILPVKQGDIFKIISDTSTPRGWFNVSSQI